MRPLMPVLLAFMLVAPAAVQAEAAFERPKCPAADTAPGAESRCIRDVRKQWQEANFAALQKTGLVFKYMARPDVDASPAAKAVLEQKTEGSFTVRFSVAPDGTVYNAAAVDVTDGMAPLAKLWADTIGQWTFMKTAAAVTNLEHRRIYMYPAEDDGESTRKAPGSSF
jgi:hypothetical protein